MWFLNEFIQATIVGTIAGTFDSLNEKRNLKL